MLGREPTHNLYLLGLLEDFGVLPSDPKALFAFHGRFIDGELTAAVFVGGSGGLVVPSASPAASIIDIASTLSGTVKLTSALGEKNAVDALVQFLAPPRRLRLSKSQRLFSVSADDLGPFTNPRLRLATASDLQAAGCRWQAGAVKEMYDRDALAEDPDGFPARVLQRVMSKRTYVLEEKQPAGVSRVDVGSRSSFGAELEGVYTQPDDRRHAHATLCLGQISRHLLSSLPRLTMRVDDSNQLLAGLARKVGFMAGRAQRLVIA